MSQYKWAICRGCGYRHLCCWHRGRGWLCGWCEMFAWLPNKGGAA